MLLSLIAYLTVSHMALPTRWCILCVTDITTLVCYLSVSFGLGTPEEEHHFQLMILMLLVMGLSIGKRRMEGYERSAFLTLLNERQLRCQAEHQLANLEDSPRRQFQLPEDMTSLSFSVSMPSLYGAPSGGSRHLLPTHSIADSQQIISENRGSRRTTSMQTDAMPVENKGTETVLRWSEDGWQCQRCLKPPRIPTSEGSDSHRQVNMQQPERRAGSREKSRRRSDRRECVGPPQVSSFKLTCDKTKHVMIEEVLSKWNCERGHDAQCCPFHSAVREARRTVHRLENQACNPLWMPVSAGQCDTCGTMFDVDTDGVCEVCGKDVSIQDDKADHTSPQTPDDIPSVSDGSNGELEQSEDTWSQTPATGESQASILLKL
eukprot:gnl/MRDRNA2_/MRDRNA2_70490_c0_seq1.p1 gnl/MRDRNA2_/MRDRNA2_70490_c0~~gnl/MRDRNA2_/MRDRNA2_70490_c0_seq1.p1  ORF type:complete len:413 (+),score=52.75 gnl/MRDRNA2_/MRDRNA2_70490_c0_seq1:109-1239(+)